MRHRATILLLAALAAAPAAPAAASCERPAGVDVAVGLREAPPFIASEPIRGRRGLSFDLWQSIERQLRAEGLIARTAFVECPLGDQLRALAAGDLDLVISPLTITAERMRRFDFSPQYLSSGITVARRDAGGIDFGYAAAILRDTLGRRGVPAAILVFLSANLILAALLVRALRERDGLGVPPAGPPLRRVGRMSVETVLRTIGLKGIGDGAPSAGVHAAEIAMAVVGAALSATVFGVLTTALVGSVGGQRPLAPADLAGLRVATLVDSTSEAFLEAILRPAGPAAGRVEPVSLAPGPCAAGAGGCVATPTWSEAMALLAAGEVDVVLGDWAQLSYLARQPQHSGQVAVQAAAFQLEPYGWGISRARPELRAAIDRALADRLRSPGWRQLVQEYMGDGSISPE
jgi:ABC-type amino acid transport substrate-binding protein